MNKKLGFLIVVLMSVFQGAAAQDLFSKIKPLIKAGNAEELAKYFHASIDVNIEGDLNTFSKPQAVVAIGNFFKAHPPADFNIVHKVASDGGLESAIGKMASGGETYTVLVRTKEIKGVRAIHDISFTK